MVTAATIPTLPRQRPLQAGGALATRLATKTSVRKKRRKGIRRTRRGGTAAPALLRALVVAAHLVAGSSHYACPASGLSGGHNHHDHFGRFGELCVRFGTSDLVPIPYGCTGKPVESENRHDLSYKHPSWLRKLDATDAMQKAINQAYYLMEELSICWSKPRNYALAVTLFQRLIVIHR